MNVIERSVNKRPLMVVAEIEASDAKKDFRINGEASSESDCSTEVRSCKTVYRNRCKKLVVSDTSLIDTGGKDDREPIARECFADKKDDKGTDSFLASCAILTTYCHDRHVIRGYGRGVAERWNIDQDEEKEETEVEFARRESLVIPVFLSFTFDCRYLTICTSNCKYDVVRRVAARFGMKEVTEDSSWNLYWTDLSVSVERAKDMKRYQKVNHFPGMTEICRKDLLARNLNRMLKLFPKDYNFFPKTWCFPADKTLSAPVRFTSIEKFTSSHGEAIAYAKLRRSKTFIIKPDTGCQGRGIYLTKNLKDVKPTERMICQVYVARVCPAFSTFQTVRLYSSFHEERSFVSVALPGRRLQIRSSYLRVAHLLRPSSDLRLQRRPCEVTRGLATSLRSFTVVIELVHFTYARLRFRFATSRYKEPTGHNTSNVFMHLTNYAVNKHSRMYVIDDEIGSKRKISTLNKWFKMKDVDVDELWRKIDEIIIKTILAAYPILKHSYHTCFPTHDKTYACFELLGFDVLLDWKLRPYLLEVNHSPSFHTDAQIDKDVKEGLLTNTFEMLNLQQCDKKKIIEEDRKRVRDRLLQGISSKDGGTNEPTIGTTKPDKQPEDDYLQKQFKWEDEHMGDFRRIYPCCDSEKYQPFFRQTSISVYQDTVASRAREEASRMQKEENEMRTKEQESRKIPENDKSSDTKLRSECSSVTLKPATTMQDKSVAKRSPPCSNTKKQTTSTTNTSHSFEPEIICESEERERVTALAQRDFLIKSYGMLEQIYMAMKKNGTLRAIDEKKYGLYGRLGHTDDHASKSASICRHKCHLHQHAAVESWTNQSSQLCLKASEVDNTLFGIFQGNLQQGTGLYPTKDTRQILDGRFKSERSELPSYQGPRGSYLIEHCASPRT
ncbi:unnamed protein product [Heterotrigona itama]|uniref:Tubulin--tyrosine ligase-like protein 9 n=1 Tax=Heterotrigona itama TaxID=395501 RepID=A0A6V7HP53_9HYME|nr:unnamed protein product [Heterotrigona itama]